MLGVRRREDVFVLNNENRFKDGMNEDWDDREIAKVLASAFAPQLNPPSPPNSGTATPTTSLSTTTTKDSKSSHKHKSKKSATTLPPKPAPAPATTTGSTPPTDRPWASIDVLLTFDASGISSHPNHIALHRGAALFLRNLMRPHAGHACPVSLYTLTTVNILRKYAFILDVVPTLLLGIFESIFSSASAGGGGSNRAARNKIGDKLVFVSDFQRYWKAREAMVSGHQSQMVWFRWGWIGVGRYMVVNDLKRERIVGT